MRALLLTTEIAGLGGVQYVGRLLLRALHHCLGSDCQLTLVTVKDQNADPSVLPVNCRVFGGGSRVRTCLTATSLLRRQAWDLLFLAHINLAPLVIAVSQARQPPLLAFIHGLEAWQPIRRLRRRGLSRVDRILYNSRYCQNRSQSVNPWLARIPSSVCHLALQPEGIENGSARSVGEGPSATQSQPRGTFALSIGRMASSENYKGHEEMIRIWPSLEKPRPDLRLVLIGDGDDRPRLESLARQLCANTQFLGRVSDAVRDAYLQACRCFCMPSRGEGFGLVYLEAMRAAKAVLASSLDAGSEVILDGITGRAVDPTNREALLQGILDVSGPQAESMGKAGYQHFCKHFTYDRFLERFSQHVHALLGARKVVAS